MTHSPNTAVNRVNCLMMFDEVWALKLRLKYEYDFFDSFVIVESKKTFAGREKLLYFREYASEFADFRDKIEYVEVDDLPSVRQESYVHTEDRLAPENRWPLERFSRNACKRGLDRLNLTDNTLLVIQDMDEITCEESVERADWELDNSSLMRFCLLDYRQSVRASSRKDSLIVGGYAIRGTLRNFDFHYMRRAYLAPGGKTNTKMFALALQAGEQLTVDQAIPTNLRVTDATNAGWHLSHMSGGFHGFIRFKVDNFAHSESSVGREPLDSTVDYYKLMLEYVDKNSHRYDYQDIDPDLPDFIKDNIHDFPVLLLPRKEPAPDHS